jgi:hypothetical protein
MFILAVHTITTVMQRANCCTTVLSKCTVQIRRISTPQKINHQRRVQCSKHSDALHWAERCSFVVEIAWVRAQTRPSSHRRGVVKKVNFQNKNVHFWENVMEVSAAIRPP